MDVETHRLVVPRTARYGTLGAIDEDVEEVWVLLHGYGQLAHEFLERAGALASSARLLVAPEGLSRFYHEDHRSIGASWMTREDRDHEMADYIRYLDLLKDQLFDALPASRLRLLLLGFSQGVATATRWAVRGTASVDALIAWGDALPPEVDDEPYLSRLRELNLVCVRGARDKLFTEQAQGKHRERLERLGLTYRDVRFDGGHRLDDDTLRELAATL